MAVKYLCGEESLGIENNVVGNISRNANDMKK
jgi:hypothetical protein